MGSVTMIRVVEHDDGCLYSLDNRRLAVFRLLQLAGRVRKIKAKVVTKAPAEWRLSTTHRIMVHRLS